MESLAAVEDELRNEDSVWANTNNGTNHLYDLLSSLQMHLLAHCVSHVNEVSIFITITLQNIKEVILHYILLIFKKPLIANHVIID